MKQRIRDAARWLALGPFNGLFVLGHHAISCVRKAYFRVKWARCPMPDEAAVQLMRENVTVIYKSFERQKQAMQLYRCLQRFYPGIRVIIADDSKVPLEAEEPYLQILHLPFNSGLSRGLNCALRQVETPYLIRMDDDELLTPFTNFDGQLRFLMEHPEVDLVSVLLFGLTAHDKLEKLAAPYYGSPMNVAPMRLKIPHMTRIDGTHIVVGKAPNTFIARTEKMKEIGYDDNIRVIDHNEFFFRAAGRMVSVLDPTAYVLHDHNRFDRHYRRYRSNISDDQKYIVSKMIWLLNQAHAEQQGQNER